MSTGLRAFGDLRLSYDMRDIAVTPAAKALKANGAAAEAYVNFEFISPPTEVWITAVLGYTADALTFWDSNNSAYLIRVGTYEGVNDAAAFITSGPSWQLHTGGGGQDFPAPAAGGAMHTIEFHYKDDGTTNLYQDTALISTHTSSHTEAPASFAVGLDGGGGSPATDPASISYFASVIAGTSRGANDLFSDDFESGTLAAWTHTVGDVTVVTNPF